MFSSSQATWSIHHKTIARTKDFTDVLLNVCSAKVVLSKKGPLIIRCKKGLINYKLHSRSHFFYGRTITEQGFQFCS